jgi:hypothetical protein
MEVGGQRHAPAAFTPGKEPVPIVQEAGWAPGSVWVGAENLAPTGIRSPELPARSAVAIPTELSRAFTNERESCYRGADKSLA